MGGCASRKLGHNVFLFFLLHAVNNISTQFASHVEAIAVNEYPLQNRLLGSAFPLDSATGH